MHKSFLPLLTTVILLTGCQTTEPAPATTSGISVRATNRNFKAVEVYAVGIGRRVFLGRLSAGATASFDLPGEIFDNDLSLRFQIESVDRTFNFTTTRIAAVRGEEIILIIPNEQ